MPSLTIAAAYLLVSCGYRPLFGGRSNERYCVVGVSPLAADASAVSEVEAGLRAELAKGGELRSGGGYPRVVVEVLRIDTESEAIAAVPGGMRPEIVGGLPLVASGPSRPLARGSRIGVLARAWLERAPSAPRERDTGDLRAVDVVTVESDARIEALRRDDAARAAARRLGARLARRIRGEPDAPDDGM